MEQEEVTAQPTEKAEFREEELSVEPEDLARRMLERATESGTTESMPTEDLEIAVPPNQLENEDL